MIFKYSKHFSTKCYRRKSNTFTSVIPKNWFRESYLKICVGMGVHSVNPVVI